ncbi:hypothetical protein MUK42_09894 [Musa troglodytarum]|uniref:Uncharacterized protein n=1 Tax=Musa troglodytarum TaxID=320322 RepID=A0A9E7J9Z2_9LILI|nr:hypothetical protein MUK42_09894 [Musa troglodytarum]
MRLVFLFSFVMWIRLLFLGLVEISFRLRCFERFRYCSVFLSLRFMRLVFLFRLVIWIRLLSRGLVEISICFRRFKRFGHFVFIFFSIWTARLLCCIFLSRSVDWCRCCGRRGLSMQIWCFHLDRGLLRLIRFGEEPRHDGQPKPKLSTIVHRAAFPRTRFDD